MASPFYTGEHEAYREVVRRFVEKEIAPYAHEWDEAGGFPRELYEKAAAIGLLGLGFPEEYGGTEVDYVTFARIFVELSRGWLGLAGIIGTHLVLADVVVVVDAVGDRMPAVSGVLAELAHVDPGRGVVRNVRVQHDAGAEHHELEVLEPRDGFTDERTNRRRADDGTQLPHACVEQYLGVGPEQLVQLRPRTPGHDVGVRVLQPADGEIVDRLTYLGLHRVDRNQDRRGRPGLGLGLRRLVGKRQLADLRAGAQGDVDRLARAVARVRDGDPVTGLVHSHPAYQLRRVMHCALVDRGDHIAVLQPGPLGRTRGRDLHDCGTGRRGRVLRHHTQIDGGGSGVPPPMPAVIASDFLGASAALSMIFLSSASFGEMNSSPFMLRTFFKSSGRMIMRSRRFSMPVMTSMASFALSSLSMAM